MFNKQRVRNLIFLIFPFLLGLVIIIKKTKNVYSGKENVSFSKDTTNVNRLLELSDEYYFLSPDSVPILLQKAYDLSENHDWEKGKANINFKLGIYKFYKNELMSAIDLFYKALFVFEKHNLIYEVALTKRSLGDCYSLLGDFEKAIRLNNESLKSLKIIKNEEEYITGINNLALVYHDSKDYKRAIRIFRYGITLNEEKEINLGSLEVNLAISLLKDKQVKVAIDLCNKLINNPNLSLYNRSIIYSTIADAYFENKQIVKAEQNLHLSQNVINQMGGNNDLALVLVEPAMKIYKELNNKSKELEYVKKYHELNYLRIAENSEKRIQSLQFEYENKNHKNSIENLKKNRVYLFGVLSIFLILGIILFWVNRKLKFQKIEIENQAFNLDLMNKTLEDKVSERTKELMETNTKLKQKNNEIIEALYKGQSIERKRVAAELHDNLGAILSALKWRLEALDLQILNEKEQKIYLSIKNMMSSAYNEVRYISHNLLPAEFEKYGLIGAIKKLVLEINENNSIRIKLDIEEYSGKNLSKKIELELYSVVLELINNILKHSEAKHALLKISCTQQKTMIAVGDDGVGLDKMNLKGKGITNIRERLRNINGNLVIGSNDKWNALFTVEYFF